MTSQLAPKNRYEVDLDALEEEHSSQLAHASQGKQPAASPKARWFAVFIGLALIAACAITVRDLLIHYDRIQGSELLPPAADWLGSFDLSQYALPVGIGAGIVALIFLLMVFSPRRRRHVSFSPMYLRPVDVARIATATARSVPGVINAHSVATKKKVTVTAVPALDSDGVDLTAVENDVRAALSHALGEKEARGGVDLIIKMNKKPGANQQ